MYIMTKGEGVYRSNNGGRNWSAVNSGLPKSIGAAPIAPIESAVIDPTNANIVYVATEVMGIYKTTNGGKTWIKASKGLPDPIMYRASPGVLAIDPSNSQRLLLWAGWPVNSEWVDNGFFISEDGAANWSKLTARIDDGRVFAIQFVDPKIGIAVAITDDGVMPLSK
jgi:photosystem II stability/assembly factor-like uncharacterized protein